MLGLIVLIFWLASWYGIARWLGKGTKPRVIKVGEGFLLSFIPVVVIGFSITLFQNFSNPEIDNWEIGKHKQPQEGVRKQYEPDIGIILDPDSTRTKPRSSANREIVVASEYGNKWSFTVPGGELECISNAVIMHTVKGTYSINGKAMGRYAGKLPEWREIAKPVPGLENDPRAKMPPPTKLIKKGLALCR